MRARPLIRLIRPFWPVLLVAILVLAGGLFMVRADTGLWAGRVVLTAVAPSGGGTGRGLTAGGPTLVDFAALVERQYVGASQPDRFASDTATLVGSGVTEGSRVFLANAGGQWADNFNSPAIIVESVSHDRRRALRLLGDAISGLDDRAASLQEKAGVDPDNQITFLASPARPEVDLEHGSKARAVAASAALAVLAAIATGWIIRRLRRRQRLESSRSQVAAGSGRPDRARSVTTT
ncbi:hypothetical protein [Pseudolysinimonas sp.]|uniref:hypothetical protein n=1 Tax=Pseudolysinimonas sp. TaxID=2680009 RepID=UPI003F81817B